MGVSHDRNTLGPPDQAGISPITLGGPLPKRDGAWEPHGGVKPGSEPRGVRIAVRIAGSLRTRGSSTQETSGSICKRLFLLTRTAIHTG